MKPKSPMNPEQTPTLMLAYENLLIKARKVEELQELSERLNRKFDRTDDRPLTDNCEDVKEKKQIREPNLIELFDSVSERLERSINNIGGNIERIIQMID